MTPYYNVWGRNSGFGVGSLIENEKLQFGISYNRTALINSFNLFKLSPAFTPEDRKANSRKLEPIYWKTNEWEFTLGFNVLEQNNIKIFANLSAIIYRGQLHGKNFPFPWQFESPEFELPIIYNNGEEGVLKYTIYQMSVRDIGLSILPRLQFIYDFDRNITGNINIGYNAGLTPLTSSLVKYEVSSESIQNSFHGEYNSLSYISGFRFGLGIGYNIPVSKQTKRN